MQLPNIAHLHLLLNHVPTVGTVVALGLLLLAMIRLNEHLSQASLEGFFLFALLTIPVYLTGIVSEASLKHRPGVSGDMMTAHQDAATLALALMELTGGFA